MVKEGWFKFEDNDYDFPFYKKNPHIPKWGWIVLFFAWIIGFILIMFSNVPMAILCCIVFIVPVLYFLNWDYHAIFRMPSGRDVALAVALFVGYLIYAMLMGILLEHFGIVSSGLVDGESVTICNFLSSVLPQQKFEAMDGLVLHLGFIWQPKENTSSRCEGGPTQKKQREA